MLYVIVQPSRNVCNSVFHLMLLSMTVFKKNLFKIYKVELACALPIVVHVSM